MSQDDLSIPPWTPVRDAAALMREEGVAAIPVMVDDLPVGIITDRDIVIRLLPAPGDTGARPVSDAMTRDPVTCLSDHDVAHAAAVMGDAQVRHLVVMDRIGDLVGVLSVDDIAENASEDLAGQTLGEIVERRSRRCRARSGVRQRG